ncbi:hypothetical protein C8T65DRAFT_739067 [Cerioporus squamosus]|nr:hypothetical protein C8T65DRAFT_739067 [Cerioporus squamosus]
MRHHRDGKRRLRPPMPDIHATREANRSSQLYSSFPPLACVRGFAPCLYALELSGAQPAGGHHAVERELGTRTGLVGLGAQEGGTRGRERGLKGIFGSAGTEDASAWTGVNVLVVRVEEPGRWKDVTSDVAAMLLPLANTLVGRPSPSTARRPTTTRTTTSSRRRPRARGQNVSRDKSRANACAALSPRRDPARQPRPPYHFNFSPSASLVDGVGKSNPPAATAADAWMTEDGQRRYERRFWRVDRSEGWLCLDPLSEAAARKLMEAEGLTFEDRVRY